jgi:prevent-host-death family protein
MAEGSFKAPCLKVMDEVQATWQCVLITKHGKRVVTLVPADKSADEIYHFLRGKDAVVVVVISPAVEDSRSLK